MCCKPQWASTVNEVAPLVKTNGARRLNLRTLENAWHTGRLVPRLLHPGAFIEEH
jgi:hypothetical protein